MKQMTNQNPEAGEAAPLIAKLAAYLEQDIGTARALPMEMYASKALLDAEREHVLKREWLCVGRLEQVEAPGDYFTVELLGEPVVIVRDREGVLRAMSAVCRHRYYSVVEGAGNAKVFSCPYHKWGYGLDGCLRGAPHMDAVDELKKRGQSDRLPQFPLETWLGFIFVNLDTEAEPLLPRLADAEPHWSALGVEEWRVSPWVDEEWPGNWKLAMETALEGYHVNGLHPETFASFMPSRGTAFEATSEQWTLFRMETVFKGEYEVYRPFADRLTGKDQTTVPQFGFFPNCAVSCTQFNAIWLTFLPIDVDRTRVIGGNLVHPDLYKALEADAALRDSNAASIDRVNSEDASAMVGLQRNAASAHAEPGLLCEMERCLLHFYRYLAQRLEHGVRGS